MFDKAASVYFIREIYLHFSIAEMASPGNRHCARCIGTLSFPIMRADLRRNYCDPYADNNF